MDDDIYANIDIATKNIRAVIESDDFNIKDKKDLIIVAIKNILDNLKLI